MQRAKMSDAIFAKRGVNEIIGREQNPRVAMGLRLLSNGREEYTYNSALDKEFVHTRMQRL